MTTKTEPTPIEQIEAAAQKFAIADSCLRQTVTEVNATILEAKLSRRKEILRRKKERTIAREVLSSLVDAHRELFAKPKTRVLHGIKVGLCKGSGKMVIEDEEKTLALIRKHFPDQIEDLIRTTFKPDKEALEHLDAADLKRVAVVIEGTGDRVIVAVVESDTEKLLKALKIDEEQTEVES